MFLFFYCTLLYIVKIKTVISRMRQACAIDHKMTIAPNQAHVKSIVGFYTDCVKYTRFTTIKWMVNVCFYIFPILLLHSFLHNPWYDYCLLYNPHYDYSNLPNFESFESFWTPLPFNISLCIAQPIFQLFHEYQLIMIVADNALNWLSHLYFVGDL